VVVGDDIAVGRDDEAGAERLRLARLGLLPVLLLFLEAAEQLVERRAGRQARDAAQAADFDFLRGRNVDHRGLKPRGQVGEAAGRAAGGGHLRLRAQRFLRCLLGMARFLKGKCRGAGEQNRRAGHG